MENKEAEIKAKIIQAQIELLRGYYNKIFLNKMTVEDILNSMEADRIYLQQEQNILDAENLLNS